MPKILCVDFDGVLHSYTSGWQGADVINDPPVPGALNWLCEVTMEAGYEIHIYSSRSSQEGGIEAMQKWLASYLKDNFTDTPHNQRIITTILKELRFPTQKPPAYLTIDDRAICFRGTFPSILEMGNFKPWNK